MIVAVRAVPSSGPVESRIIARALFRDLPRLLVHAGSHHLPLFSAELHARHDVALIMSSPSAPGRPNAVPRAPLNLALVALLHAFAPVVKAIPLFHQRAIHALEDEDLPKSPDDASLWLYLSIAIALVLAGGVFAGLTIA